MPSSAFWLQYGSQNSDELVGLAADLERTGSRPGVVFVPVGAPERLKRLYQLARGGGEAFLAPSGFLLDRKESPQRRKNFPWLEQAYRRPTDVAGWAQWMEHALEHQLSEDLRGNAAEPSLLVTPAPQLTGAAGTQELYDIVDAATAARDSTAGGRECWLEIVVDRDYLRQEARLTELANTIVTAGFPGVVFRCFHSELPPVSDRRLLEGLRELVEGCAGADIGFFLPNSGWLGWLAMAWGSMAFSGGLARSSWYDRMPGAMANVPKRQMIFEHQLIRHVDWTLHTSLMKVPEYRACACASCEAMGRVYQQDLERVHQLRVAHAWSDDLKPRNIVGRRQTIRTQLDAAIDFREALPIRMRERAESGFLDTWRALV
jgi:hypothetical protein